MAGRGRLVERSGRVGDRHLVCRIRVAEQARKRAGRASVLVGDPSSVGPDQLAVLVADQLLRVGRDQGASAERSLVPQRRRTGAEQQRDEERRERRCCETEPRNETLLDLADDAAT